MWTGSDIMRWSGACSATYDDCQGEMHALEDTLRPHSTDEQIEAAARRNAAVRIQKAWRKHMRKQYLQPDFLWSDLVTHARMRVRHPALRSLVTLAQACRQLDRDAAEQATHPDC